MARRILIVDGHSVIFAWPRLRRLHERRMMVARDELVKVLTEYQDKSGVKVVVVFDGAGDKPTETTEEGGIQVFYSSASKTADDIVERLVAKYGAEDDITVATSDLQEQQTAIAFGANCVSAEKLKEVLDETREQFERDSKRHLRKD